MFAERREFRFAEYESRNGPVAAGAMDVTGDQRSQVRDDHGEIEDVPHFEAERRELLVVLRHEVPDVGRQVRLLRIDSHHLGRDSELERLVNDDRQQDVGEHDQEGENSDDDQR